MVAQALAELLMVLHYAFISFLIVGGFLAWRWPKVIYAHVAMAIWGVLIVSFPIDCPLTIAENFFRAQAGQPQIEGFIDVYIDGVLYPESAGVLVQIAVGIIVLISWFGFYTRRKTDHFGHSARTTG